MSLIVRYSLVGVAITAAYVNFISCGAQSYKASLAEDHTPSEEGEANFKDPASPEFGLHAPKGWTKLPIVYTVEKKLDPIQVAALQAAMTTWEKAVGKKLFAFNPAGNKDGAGLTNLASSLGDKLNGHYDRPDWTKTGKKDNVIATTIWQGPSSVQISDADIHYNSNIYFLSDALLKQPVDSREIVDMQSLALHELGHLLGLAHVEDTYDSSSIMNPSLYIGVGLATRSLSVNDVKRIQAIYGCEGSACDQAATAREIMMAAQKASSKAQSSQSTH